MTRRDLLLLALLWLGGFDLRVTVLAVPPVIPGIGHDLHLTASAVGVLTSLLTFLLAVAAVPGALLVARLGPRRTLLAGMAAVALAGAVRGVGPAAAVLYAATVVMGVGVAVCQLAMPSLAGAWQPARIGLATAVYANGLLVGEMVPPVVDPWLLPALGQSWELGLAAWSVPVALLLGLALAATREAPAVSASEVVARFPDFRSGQIWLLGLTLGMISASYWGANAFIPGLVTARGEPGLKDAALISLNACQLLASAALVAAGGRLPGRRWPLVVAGVMLLAGSGGMVLTSGVGVVLSAALIGWGSALGLILLLALPPLLAAPARVSAFAAGIFTVGYLAAFVGPVLGGAAADLTHAAVAPFVLLTVAGLLCAGLASVAPLHPEEAARVPVAGGERLPS